MREPIRLGTEGSLRVARRVASLIVCLSLAACFSPAFPEGRACTPTGECPGDLICSSGVCVSSPTGSDGGVDVGGDGDGDAGGDGDGDSDACGAAERFGDPFSEKPFWLGAFPEPTSLSFAANTMSVNLPVGPAFAAASSRFSLQLRDDRLFVEVLPADPGVTPAVVLVAPNENARFRISDAMLTGEHTEPSGTAISANTIAYSETAHRYLSFREEGEMLFLEASPDAATWTVVHSISKGTLGDDVQLRFDAFSGAGVAAGAARFANLNNRAEFGPGCPTSDVVETFDNATVGSALQLFVPDCVPTTTGSEFEFVFNNGVVQPICALNSRYLHDLTDNVVSLTTTQSPPVESGVFLALELDFAEGFLQMSAVGGMVKAEVCPNRVCTVEAEQAYDVNGPLFWRVREMGGSIRFEISTDGITYTVLFVDSTPWPLDAGRVNIYTIGNAPITGNFKFDSLNTP